MSTNGDPVPSPNRSGLDPTTIPDHGPEQLLTLREAASLLNVHRETVREWCDEGKLPRLVFGPRTHRIKRSDVDDFKQNSTTGPGGS